MYEIQRELIYSGDVEEKRGIIGEYTGYNFKGDRLHVGDLVVYELEFAGAQAGVVVNFEGRFVIMGAAKTPLHNNTILKKVIGYKLLTEEIVNHLHRLTIKEMPRQMTVEQIADELGYSIEIVASVHI